MKNKFLKAAILILGVFGIFSNVTGQAGDHCATTADCLANPGNHGPDKTEVCHEGTCMVAYSNMHNRFVEETRAWHVDGNGEGSWIVVSVGAAGGYEKTVNFSYDACFPSGSECLVRNPIYE
jgi:hypothetical protein